jgi:outer membrane protein OmpA-like peptidoglycan-associated protein/opacity protein-like surface antigen
MKGKCPYVLMALVLIALTPLMAQHSDGKTSIGVYGGAKKLLGDTNHDQDIISPMVGAKLGYDLAPYLTLTLNGGFSTTYPRDAGLTDISKWYTKLPNTPFKTTLMPILLDAKANFRPESKLNPFITWGVGILRWDLQNNGVSVHGKQTDALVDFGAGVEWFLTENLGLDLGANYQHILRQNLDMAGYGDVQTGIFSTRLGINFYFGGNTDTDGDGVLNKVDRCPKVAEDIDGFQDEDGCPDLDNDGDGIPDALDKCPNLAEDKDGFQDEDGCPDLDNDGDGIPDSRDKCPNLAEDKDGFQDEDGCPDLDNDADGIPDTLDKCPNEAETVNGYMDDDGCPDKKPEIVIEKQAPIVLEGVNFETGKDILVPGAKLVLDKVYQTLVDYPEMKLEVRGYTDDVGKRASNVKLSQRRADAVKSYLVSKGVAETRIQTKGLGPDNPVAPNTTTEGRLKNRRIEFQRID